MKSETTKAAGKASLDPLVLPSVLGDSLAELNRMRDSITASMGIPARFLRCDPPLHPTYSEYQATARAEPVVSSPGSDGYWWMLDTHLPVRWELVRVSGKKNVFRVESQTEIQPPRCCAKWVKVREPEGR